jgi:hypothetical protein
MSTLEPTSPPLPQTKRSVAAIWSLVLGILSFCLTIFAGIPAIILGIIGIRNVNRDPQRLTGKGLSIAGLITGFVGTLISLVQISAALTAYMGVQERALQIKNTSTLTQVGMACRMYAADHDGKFPDSLNDLTPDYVTEVNDLFVVMENREEVAPRYVSGKKLTQGSDATPLAMPPDQFGSRVPVLFTDGVVQELHVPLSPEILAGFD